MENEKHKGDQSVKVDYGPGKQSLTAQIVLREDEVEQLNELDREIKAKLGFTPKKFELYSAIFSKGLVQYKKDISKII